MARTFSSLTEGLTYLDSAAWVDQLHPGHPHRDETVARLHAVLLRSAFSELARRREQLSTASGCDVDDLAHQAADDALMKILGKLDDFRGLSRFTTWACKFVIFEVWRKAVQHVRRAQQSRFHELELEHVVDRRPVQPVETLEQHEQLRALAAAIAELTERQREAFVAVALNEVPADVLAVRLDSNRNAIYKNLSDARRSLRASMAAAGHPVHEKHAA